MHRLPLNIIIYRHWRHAGINGMRKYRVAKFVEMLGNKPWEHADA